MMTSFLLSGLLVALASSTFGAEHPERWYQERAAEKLGGKMEVVVPDGRVDIVTEDYAIEVEFAAKWKNAIGQALWYAMQTNKKAGIIVICETKKDVGDAIRLESVIEHNKLPIRVWRSTDDVWKECFGASELREDAPRRGADSPPA